MEETVKRKLNPNLLLAAVILALLLAVMLVFLRPKNEPEAKVDVSVTLKKIVQTSDLSAAAFDYRGIVPIPNQKKPQKIDFYVLYDASVYAGIDFSEITFTEDKDKKTITATLPPVWIQDTVVDPASMEFIFQDKKANDISVMGTALKACEEDIRQECISENALLSIAQINAENAVRALTEPVMSTLCEDYTLLIETKPAAVEEGSASHED